MVRSTPYWGELSWCLVLGLLIADVVGCTYHHAYWSDDWCLEGFENGLGWLLCGSDALW